MLNYSFITYKMRIKSTSKLLAVSKNTCQISKVPRHRVLINSFLKSRPNLQAIDYLYMYLWHAFSSCGELGLLSSCSALASHFRTQALELGFQNTSSSCGTSSVALRHVTSSQTRGQTHVPHVGSQTIHHWTTREVLL